MGKDVELLLGNGLSACVFGYVSDGEYERCDRIRDEFFNNGADEVIWLLGFEGLEVVLELFQFDGGEQVNFQSCGGSVPVIAHLSGNSEGAGARDSVMRKEEIALPTGDFFGVDSGFKNDVSKRDARLDGLPF